MEIHIEKECPKRPQVCKYQTMGCVYTVCIKPGVVFTRMYKSALILITMGCLYTVCIQPGVVSTPKV